MLRSLGIKISDASIDNGYRNVCSLTGLAGRWMQLAQSPLTICDTGHNQAGLQYNLKQLDHLIAARTNAKLHIVMGFVADKDIEHIIQLFPKNATYYISNAQIPRALPVDQLAEKCSSIGLEFTKYSTVESAYIAAKNAASDNDIIYIGGSTFVVADLLASLK